MEKQNNDSFEAINEEIRQFRLERIQETEVKLFRFIEAYNEIKEYLVIKFTKNASLNLIRVILAIIFFLLIVGSTLFFFPSKLIDTIQNSGKVLSGNDINAFKFISPYVAYFFLVLAVIFFYIGFLLKKNIKSRNNIYNLNKLLEEVIEYMEVATTEERRKYEYHIDYLEELKNRKTPPTTFD